MAGTIHNTIGWQGVPFTFLARVTGFDGTLITQAVVDEIRWRVIDTTDDAIIDDGTLTKTAVIFDTLQTDGRWTTDSLGYNFRTILDGDNFAIGGRRYRVEIEIDTDDGNTVPVVYLHLAKQLGDQNG
jgi:hypothetical protein